MRYPFTCQTLDVSISDSLTFSPSGTPSPPSFAFVNRFYDPILSARRQSKKTAQFHQHKSNVLPDMTGPKDIPKINARKLDFSIESILGLDKAKSGKFSPGISRICDDFRREPNLLPSAPTYPVSTSFPDALEIADKKSRNEEADVSTRYTLLSTPHSHSKSSSSNSNSQKSPPHHGAGKAKRIRTIFTPDQLERLECEFERQQYMVGPERMYLASALNLSESQVKIWFQNRRIKWRKQHLEMQQAKLAQLRDAETAESESDPDQTNLAKHISPGQWDMVDDRN